MNIFNNTSFWMTFTLVMLLGLIIGPYFSTPVRQTGRAYITVVLSSLALALLTGLAYVYFTQETSTLTSATDDTGGNLNIDELRERVAALREQIYQ